MELLPLLLLRRLLARRFLAGCLANGVTRIEARGVWELIANFAAFGFASPLVAWTATGALAVMRRAHFS